MSHEDLLRLIDLCKVVEARGVDPFEVNVLRSLETLRRHLPSWRLLEELLLDAEALNQLAMIVKLQEEWIRHHSSSIYVDPLLVELKVRMSRPEELAQALIMSWRPTVELDQMLPGSLIEAMDYWNRLLPLAERLKELLAPQRLGMGSLGRDELIRLRLLSEKEFNRMLQGLLWELRAGVGPGGRVEYWGFICSGSFEEAVLRAYLTSFLVTEGSVLLEVDPLEEEVHLVLREGGPPPRKRGTPMSVALPINQEVWERYSEAKGG